MGKAEQTEDAVSPSHYPPAARETPAVPEDGGQTCARPWPWGGGSVGPVEEPHSSLEGAGHSGRELGQGGQGACSGSQEGCGDGAPACRCWRNSSLLQTCGAITGVPRDLRAAPRPQASGREGPGVGRGVCGPFCPSSAPDPGGRMSRVMVEPEVAPRWPERGPTSPRRRDGGRRGPALLTEESGLGEKPGFPWASADPPRPLR